jgi:hypothetical protein
MRVMRIAQVSGWKTRHREAALHLRGSKNQSLFYQARHFQVVVFQDNICLPFKNFTIFAAQNTSMLEVKNKNQFAINAM